MEKPYSATNAPIPQHTTFTFEGIEFSSDFDSGNLLKVEKQTNTSYFLWMGPDCCNTLCEKTLRSWFYFKVSASGPYTFTLKNLNLQGKLFRDGMKPLVRTPTKPWDRITSPVLCEIAGEVASHFAISFDYTFEESPVYFSFSFPWSYSDHKSFLSSLPSMCLSNNIYLHHENLIYSLERRTCDLLTISDRNKATCEVEQEITGLFEDSDQRALRFTKKKVVFVSARVHAGESPASHVINGFLRFLVSEDPSAVRLRRLYLFKIVPMVNPDGVYRGHFRTDTRGNDLNRHYASPSLLHHPTIYAINQLLGYYKDRLFAYIDFHAHVSKQGCFVYGNALDFQQQIENVMFAKLMASNCPWFSFDACRFAEESRRGEEVCRNSKAGCGRAQAFKQFCVTHAYTFECNYHSAKKVGADCESGRGGRVGNVFDQGIFEKIGESVGISILQLKKEKCGEGVREVELEISKILAEQEPYKLDPDIRKASKSIENLSKYISHCKNKKGHKYRLMNAIGSADKPCRASSNTIPTSNNFKIENSLKAKIMEKINNISKLSTRCITANNNSFHIRKRSDFYMKNRKNKKLRIRSSKIQDSKEFKECGMMIL